MLINFNLPKLNKLLADFYTLTGITISVWDANFNQLSYYPLEMQPFCNMIKQSKIGKKRCFECDKNLCAECVKTNSPVTHYCHTGLIDTALPIKFKDNVLGYVMFGQVLEKQDNNTTSRIKKLCKELKLDYNILFENYCKLKIYDRQKIASAGNILITATRNLWLSDYIEIGYNTLASKINDYIRKNLSGDLSLQAICLAIGVSKNKLYEVTHEQFGCTIGQQVSKIRIDEAKKLLSTTDYPISEVSYLVGMTDYNYFTKFFKLHTGTTPLKYRKQFPFSLHDYV